MNAAIHVNKYGFARSNVAVKRLAGALQRNRLAGHHDGFAAFTLPMAHAQRPDAKRVTECQQAMPCNQRHHSVRALDTLVHTPYGSKHIGGCKRQAACGFFKLVGQHIEQHFRVAVGVDVTMVGVEQLCLQLCRVREITVVRQNQAKGRIDVKRLRFVFAERIARCGITHLPQANIAGQCPHVAGTKNIAHHAFGFVHEKLAVQLRDDARRILATVL